VGDGGEYSLDGCGMMNIMRRLLSHVGDGRVWASERTRMMGCEKERPTNQKLHNKTKSNANALQAHQLSMMLYLQS